MSILYNGDCLEEMKQIEDKSIDLIFVDLPYGQTSCKWDVKIDLTKMWEQYMRIKKLNTPIFFTTTTKFGVDIINSAPKKCPFRYDIVWCKSAPAGFLSAKKMPMRKHEMVYVFYEKLPFYDLSSHKHKFIKERDTEPEPEPESNGDVNENYDCNYGKIKTPEYITNNITRNKLTRKYKKEGKSESSYDPPLPVSVVKEPEPESKYVGKPVMRENTTYGDVISYEIKERKDGESMYQPPLPVSVVKEEMRPTEKYKNESTMYGNIDRPDFKRKDGESMYQPPLPVSVVKEEPHNIYNFDPNKPIIRQSREAQYDPPLPTTMLEIKSTRGKHSTEKPVALMEWVLKYYSKEGDVVLDNCMGSGSTGVACRNMNRNFIGIEKDPEIYEVAFNRINP